MAAGLSIKTENIAPFRESINQFAREILDGAVLIPSLAIDAEISLAQLNLKLVDFVDSLEPYGEGNPPAIFCTRNLTIKSRPQVLGKETLKFWVTDGRVTLSAVGFGMGKYREFLEVGQKVDLAYRLSIDDWNKAPVVQLKLKDIRDAQD